jgi:phospholipid/cholesterol/gamma-HCH transport system substrate-binding protein
VKPALNKAAAVGLLVAIAGAAFLFAFTFFRKGGYSEADSYVVTARFADATGLTWKSKVQIAGIQIGEVDKIALVRDRALLTIRVLNEVDLHVDACLYKTFPSALLPDALLEVNPGSEDKPLFRSLPEEQRIITCVREATSVQQLLDTMAKVAADVQTVTGDLAQTVTGKEGSLRDIIRSLASITRQVENVVAQNGGTLQDILQNTRDFTDDLREISNRDKERIHSILKNVDEMTSQLRAVATSVQGILDGREGAGPGGAGVSGPSGGPGVAGAPGAGSAAAVAQRDAQLKGVQQAVARLNDNLTKLDDILGKVSEGKSVAGKLLVDERLGRQLGTAIEGVSDYVDRLQKLQIEVQLRSEWLLNQTVSEGRPGAKIYFGAKLIPRPDKFYLLEVVSDPRGVDKVTTETVTTRPAGSSTDSTTVTSRTLHEDKVTFSLQYGKRYGPVTFRVGVIESSGGLGADLHLLDNKLQLSISMYQFSRPYQDVFPRAKVWANYHFLQHFYVTTGVDDFFNRWRTANSPAGSNFNIGTDVFFGVGLYFTDDDLKTLLVSGAGSAASAGGQ